MNIFRVSYKTFSNFISAVTNYHCRDHIDKAWSKSEIITKAAGYFVQLYD